MGASENTKGLILAVTSSAFIGTSFIFKKLGLKRAAASSGARAGMGSYTYLLQPLRWTGMVTMVIGEAANFVAYIYAPAVLVTPLGALSIIISAVLAHFTLREHLKKMGVIGCISFFVGSVVIVIHAPHEHTPGSVHEVWTLATQPGCQHQGYWNCDETDVGGDKSALDTFNAAIVSPVYYVMFTTSTIIASVIMFKDWSGQTMSSLASEMCGFITILSETIILHATRGQESPPPIGTVTWFVNKDSVKSVEARLINVHYSDKQ